MPLPGRLARRGRHALAMKELSDAISGAAAGQLPSESAEDSSRSPRCNPRGGASASLTSDVSESSASAALWRRRSPAGGSSASEPRLVSPFAAALPPGPPILVDQGNSWPAGGGSRCCSALWSREAPCRRRGRRAAEPQTAGAREAFGCLAASDSTRRAGRRTASRRSLRGRRELQVVRDSLARSSACQPLGSLPWRRACVFAHSRLSSSGRSHG